MSFDQNYIFTLLLTKYIIFCVKLLFNVHGDILVPSCRTYHLCNQNYNH